MLAYIHHSNTVIIVLHEIYGINKHIIEVCEKFSEYEIDSIAPNLLNGRESFCYDQEAIAYNYFMNTVGFESAFNQIKEVLRNARANYKKVYVLGYSVGATLAWLCSDTGLCDLAIGFYGSRIRDYLEIKPTCPVLLFFPTEEKVFDVDNLISHLTNLDNIQVEKRSGQHGFANPFSQSYNKRSSIKTCMEIMSFIRKYNV
ncbi:dienelactone hydrolase family protein [Sporomusa sp. KB1]|jgi:dienelactone hydrolase|uniref:dienelactone hydrolase family protein n=1 Tax=Sporomusa sp. KB1 TaxID=943346 RepID=UPI0011A90132|nr:dienelactone hydrolase family protein [Sporomusa sp. KB1]TWH46681.1 dienelactone hydrolase [Sporomusa sp. KB1]